MAHVNLYDYLKKLDESHLNEIEKYLESTYFEVNSRERVKRLFAAIRKYHPTYKKIDNEVLAKQLKTSTAQVSNLKTSLKNCIENYLMHNQVKLNEPLQVLLLADCLDELDLKTQYVRYANQSLKKMECQQALSAEDYYLKYQLLIKLHSLTNALDNKNTYLSEAMEALSYFYLYENLVNLNGFQLLSKVLTRNEDIDLTLNLVKSVKDYSIIENPNIKISYYVYEFRNQKNIKEKERLLKTILEIIKTDWELLTKQYRYEIYIYVINAAKSLAAKGAKISFTDIFDIHQFWIKKDVHLTFPQMNSNLFINIAIDYCVAKKLDEYHLFVKENAKYLDLNLKEETLQFCNAFYFFKNKQFQEAMNLIAIFKAKDPYGKLNIKILELKCVYELDNSTIFNSRINAFSIFLRRNKAIKQDVKNDCLSFISFLNKIASLRGQIGFESKSEINYKLNKLEKEVISKEGVLGRIWLIERITKIKKRIK